MTSRPNRRHVLSAGLCLPFTRSIASPLALQAEGGGAGKRLLVLGGTRFLGPAIVKSALEMGFEVTLFNRGKSNPELFPELERLTGDRDTGDLASLETGEWDVVVDTSGYVPDHVKQTAELLADRVRHYVFVSTISVYADFGAESSDETAAVGKVTPEQLAATKTIGDSFRAGGQLYGPLKALCEQAAEAAMPGRVSNLRSGLIVGPEDSSDRFTYWCVRVGQGGEVLAPGARDAGVQFTDVRDLGRFCVVAGRDRKAGVMNTVGFPFEVSMEEILLGAKIVLGSDASFTWVDDEYLLEQKVGPYMEMPLWLPAEMRGRFDNRKCLDAGLVCRPIGDTIRDTLAWHLEERGTDYRWRGVGIDADREAELLEGWKLRDSD
jgi:2'-hydroxyisoflavone reductase